MRAQRSLWPSTQRQRPARYSGTTPRQLFLLPRVNLQTPTIFTTRCPSASEDGEMTEKQQHAIAGAPAQGRHYSVWVALRGGHAPCPGPQGTSSRMDPEHPLRG